MSRDARRPRHSAARAAILPLLMAGALAAGAAASPGWATTAAPPRSATVTLRDIAFHPARVTVRRGGTVRFRWADGRTQHNVTSTGAHRFRSSPTQSNGAYTVRLRTAGTYRFVCTIHFGMRGRIIVR
jgi:plastocyanin